MRNYNHSKDVSGCSLNTLAQNGTTFDGQNAAIISGQGSELGNNKVLNGRAKRKIISQKMALSLIAIAEKKGQPEKVKAFWNTYYCQNRLITHDGRYHGKYCKNRFCTLCSSIRKAEIINKYYPVLKTWPEPYFVTLTVKAYPLKSLRTMLKGVIKAFRQISGNYRKMNQRGKGIRLTGIKSLECNFNPVKRTYNPHLHVIVPNKETAEILIKEWLAKWTPRHALRQSQDYRPIRNLATALIETIKYGSKIFTEPDVNKKANSSNNGKIHAAAVYNIFDAMEGLRLFDRFGFDLPKGTAKERKGAMVVTKYGEWLFVPQYFDWLNTENELTLTGYVPKTDLVNLLEYNIDLESE